MKIGNLNFKDYAAKKPIAFSPTGEFLYAKDLAAEPRLGLGSLFALGAEQQTKLTLERYDLEPDFSLAIIGAGVLSKDEAIEHIKGNTHIGQELVQAEIGYCNELISSLAAGGSLPVWPALPPFPVIPKAYWKRVVNCIWLILKTRALFCENTTDGVTTPFANYRMKYVHPEFSAAGYMVIVLKGIDDTRANFIPQAKIGLTVYISGIGHGNYTTYTGHMGDHILEVCKYDPAEVKDKAIHFLSCETAGQLGPDTVAKGAKCYAGYTENFILQWDSPSTPAVNEFELFARSDSTFDINMAHGATAQTAYNATFAAFNAAIATVPGTVAASYLTYDRDHFKLIGDPNTKILPYRYVKICFPIMELEKESSLALAGDLVD